MPANSPFSKSLLPQVSDSRHPGGTSRAPAARNSSTEINYGVLTDSLQKFGLLGFQIDEKGQRIQDVKQFGCVLSEPSVGLNVSQLRRRSPMMGRSRFFLR